jgi:hypothetical protein
MIAPSLFQTCYESWFSILGKFNGFFKYTTFHIAVKSSLKFLHLFIKFTSFFEHSS